jgi:hypothetical protein
MTTTVSVCARGMDDHHEPSGCDRRPGGPGWRAR